MNSIPKFMATVVVFMIVVLVCISIIFSGLMVTTAKTHHNNIISKIKDSDFSETVINECVQNAEEKGFAVTITKEVNVSDVEYCKVILYYDLSLPLFGKVHTGEFIGYAFPGASINVGEADHYFEIDENGVLGIKATYRWATGLDEYASDKGKDFAGSKNDLLPTEIVIPTYFNGVKVKSLRNYIFAKNTALTKITFEEGVSVIGDYAFADCTGLTEIVFPESMKDNGFSALKGTKISYLKAPFVGASPTASKNSGGYIGYIFGAEDHKSHNTVVPASLTSVSITKYVTYYACYDMDQLTNLEIGHGVISFAPYPFARCDGLTSVTIPNSIEKTEQAAFYYCSALTEVKFEDNSKISILGPSNFAYCKNLKKIKIPDTVKEIGSYCFEECDDLSFQTEDTGKIPSYVEVIGNGAFSYCDSSEFTTLDIPASVSSIDYSIVTKSTHVSKIEVDSNNTHYCTGINGELLTADKTVVVQYPYAGSTSYTVPKTVTKIFQCAFDYCDKLTTLNFESGSLLTTIADSAFSHCSDISNDIVLPTGVTSIGEYAFYHSGTWSNFRIGENVAEIGKYAFYDAGGIGCNIYLLMTTAPVVGASAFDCNTVTTGTIVKYHIYVKNDTVKGVFVDGTNYRLDYVDLNVNSTIS